MQQNMTIYDYFESFKNNKRKDWKKILKHFYENFLEHSMPDGDLCIRYTLGQKSVSIKEKHLLAKGLTIDDFMNAEDGITKAIHKKAIKKIKRYMIAYQEESLEANRDLLDSFFQSLKDAGFNAEYLDLSVKIKIVKVLYEKQYVCVVFNSNLDCKLATN